MFADASQTPPPSGRRTQTRIILIIAAALVAMLAGVTAVVLTRSGSPTNPPGATANPTSTGSPTPTGSPAPSATGSLSPTPTSAVPSAAPVFAYQPLWPFAGTADAAAWQRAYRSGGHQPWHLDAGQTALLFTRNYLGYTDIDRVVRVTVTGREAITTVGFSAGPGHLATAAAIHLARLGVGADAPWEVVGTRDTTLSLTTPGYGSPVTSPVTVGGRITGVDESLVVQVRALGTPRLAQTAGIPAGGENTPWSTPVSFTAPIGTVLTIAVSTGGHVTGVERFAITGVRVGGSTS